MTDEYIDDWLHFDIDDPELLTKQNIPLNTFFDIRDTEMFSTYIRSMIYESTYATDISNKENVDHLMSVFINHLHTESHSTYDNISYNPYHRKLRQIRLELNSSLFEAKNAETYADELRISKSHFQHLYTSLFGISFQKDLIRIRIDYAKDLLETTDLSLEQIAYTIGYNNEIHFYRQFKATTNMTPAHYRKHFRNPDFH